ncbi:MAG: PepSY-associated TM helix domain-containing protein [Spirosomataceae bacterium]
MYRKLFKIHTWFGLITGIFLLLLGLSGSLLVFREELDEWLYPPMHHVTPQGHKLSLDKQYQLITSQYPDLDGIAWLNPEATASEAHQFRLYLNDARLVSYDLGAVSLNPYTGEILRRGRSDDLEVGWIEWIFQFHFSFHLGMPGAALTAIFGITMLISILTGVLVYRKFIWKVLTFQVSINRKNWRTISSDLHRIVGVWSLVLNVIIFFTGFWMNLFAFEASVWQREVIPTKPNTLAKVSLDGLYAQATRLLPELVPSYVYLPTQPERNFSISGYLVGQSLITGGSNEVAINAFTGQVVGVTRYDQQDTWTRIKDTFFPLHVGNYGGVGIKILYVIIGLTPGLLAITGFLLWWRRKVKSKKTPKLILVSNP